MSIAANDPIAPAECPHPQLRSVKYVMANGLWQHRRQCTECEKFLAGSLPHNRLPAEAPVIKAVEYQQRLDSEWAREKARLDDKRAAARQEWLREHDLYLQTPQWRLKRKAVLNRCHYVCEGCGTERAVEVHHLTYAHWKNEFLFELVGLCIGCHERLHEGG